VYAIGQASSLQCCLAALHTNVSMYGCLPRIWVQMVAYWAPAGRQWHPRRLSWLLRCPGPTPCTCGSSTAECRSGWTARAASLVRTGSPVDRAAGLRLPQIALHLGQQRNKRRPSGTNRSPLCLGCRFLGGSEQGRAFRSSLWDGLMPLATCMCSECTELSAPSRRVQRIRHIDASSSSTFVRRKITQPRKSEISFLLR
jgi:hypothetical protein